jgi:hypothetical protein
MQNDCPRLGGNVGYSGLAYYNAANRSGLPNVAAIGI